MSEDYIRTARAKGLPERRVVLRHGMRSAITPIVTALRARCRRAARRSDPDRDRLQHPRDRAARLRRDHARQTSRSIQGTVLLGAFFIIDRQHDRRHRLRVSRSAGALLVSPDAPLLQVRGPARRVQRPTTGSCTPLMGSPTTSEPGKTLGIVGESGSGKTRLLADYAGAHPRARARASGRDPVRGPRPRRAARRRAARDPRQRHRDDLPGPAVLAASVLQGRRPARPRRCAPSPRLEGGRARARASSCSTWSGSLTRAGASTSTRTSSPAACASA